MKRFCLLFVLVSVLVAPCFGSGYRWESGKWQWQNTASDATYTWRDSNGNVFPLALTQIAIYDDAIRIASDVVRGGYLTQDLNGDVSPVAGILDYTMRGTLGWRYDANFDVDSNGNVYPR